VAGGKGPVLALFLTTSQCRVTLCSEVIRRALCPLREDALYVAAGVLAGAGSAGTGASTGAAPAGGAVGSLVEGAAAVSAVLLSLSFLRLKKALSLSIASRGIPGM